MSKRRAIFIIPVLAVAAVVVALLLASAGSNAPPSPPDPSPGVRSGESIPSPLAEGTGAVEPGTEPAAENGEAGEVDSSLPLVVRVVDGITGAIVPAESVFTCPWRWDAGSGSPTTQLVRRGAAFVLEQSPFSRGEHGAVLLGASVPEGYVTLSVHPFDAFVSPAADSLAATILVWPELPVRILALDANGPIEGIRVVGVAFENLPLRAGGSPTGKDGRTTLRGVPNIPRERLTVSVYRIAAAGYEGAELVEVNAIIEHGAEELTLTIRNWEETDVDIPEPRESLIGLGGGPGDPPPEQPRTAGARVLVRDREGSPAAGVLVVVKDMLGYHKVRTGPDGAAEFTDCVPGPGEASVRQAGFLFGAPKGFLLGDGATPNVVLTEEEGRDLAVRVLDDTGAPVPGATVEAGSYFGIPWVSVQNGVQMLNLVTGPDGWLLFRDFPAGELTISASCGSRTTNGEAGPANDLVLTLPSR